MCICTTAFLSIHLLGIHTEETRRERDTSTPMFIAALFIIAKLCLLCLLHWYVGSLPLGPEESLPSKLKALSHPWRERKTWKMRGNSDHIPTRICLLTWEGDWISEKSLWIHNKQSVLSIATALLLIMVSLWEQLSPAPWIQLLI